jgi:hypothetical protein
MLYTQYNNNARDDEITFERLYLLTIWIHKYFHILHEA